MISNEAKLEKWSEKMTGWERATVSYLHMKSLCCPFSKSMAIQVFQRDVKIGLKINNILKYF